MQIKKANTHAMRSKYYAISISVLMELMREAGIKDAMRLDAIFYQTGLTGI